MRCLGPVHPLRSETKLIPLSMDHFLGGPGSAPSAQSPPRAHFVRFSLGAEPGPPPTSPMRRKTSNENDRAATKRQGEMSLYP